MAKTYGDGSTYQDSKGNWFASLPLGDGTRRTVRGRTKAEAEAARKQMAKDRDERERLHMNQHGGRQTFYTFAEAVLNEKAENRKPSTILFYQQPLEHYILPLLGHQPLDTIDERSILNLIATYRADERIGPQTLAHIVQVTRIVLAVAEKRRLIVRNPC